VAVPGQPCRRIGILDEPVAFIFAAAVLDVILAISVRGKDDPSRKSNFNMLTSIGKLGKEFGTPNIKNLPCRIRKA
jgi:hypothetical protein